jgi:hypothetical protein
VVVLDVAARAPAAHARRRRTHQKHNTTSKTAAARKTAVSSPWSAQYRLGGW